MSHRKDLFRFTAQLGVAAALFAISPGAAVLGSGAIAVAALVGLRLDRKDADLKALIERAQTEAEAALANSPDLADADFARARTLLESCRVEIDPAAYVRGARTGSPEQRLANDILDGLDFQAGDEAPKTILELTLPVTIRVAAEHPKAHQKIASEFLAQILRDAGQAKENTEQIRELLKGKLDLSERQVRDLEKEVIALKTELGSTISLIQGFLSSILAKHVAPEDVAKTLFQLAAQWKSAGDQLNALEVSRNLSPELLSLRDRARAAYKAEQVDEAFSLLREIERRETQDHQRLQDHIRRQRETLKRQEAELLEAEKEGKLRIDGLVATKRTLVSLAISRFEPELAAQLLAEIVDLREGETPARFGALRAVGDIWYIRGRDKGLRLDLEVAIAIARIAHTRAGNADERGAALNDLGIALATLGEREPEPVRLHEAVATYHAALDEWTRDRVPLDWASVQNNLGNALRALGENETDTARLEMAERAFRAALEVWTIPLAPQDCARANYNLATTLSVIAGRDPYSIKGDEAVACYQLALEVWTQEGAPRDWAMAKTGLGNALVRFGRLAEAEEAYEAALRVRSREGTPMDWAFTRANMCNLHLAFFYESGDRARLDLAEAALHDARTVWEEAGASKYLATVEMVQAQIDSLRSR